MEFNLSDPKNIVGMSSLISDDNSREILELEKQIMNGINIKEEEIEDAKEYKKEMDNLSRFNIGNFSFNDKLQDDVYDNNPKDTLFPNVDMQPTIPVQQSTTFIPQSIEDNQLRYMTMEQKKQSHVDNVLHDLEDNREVEFDLDKEKEEDDKNSLLEQIDMLRQILEDDGIEVTNIPLVNKNSSFNDIQNVYKMLRLKNDRNRYCTLAEELILAGAYGMETLFDGEKEYFGRKPDLVGWSKTVQVRLKKCRYQTSTFVKDLMNGYNMSPGIQLLLELIPSMFLYSRKKKLYTQENKASAANNMNYDQAFSELNRI